MKKVVWTAVVAFAVAFSFVAVNVHNEASLQDPGGVGMQGLSLQDPNPSVQ